jgi:hypothetical protein
MRPFARKRKKPPPRKDGGWVAKNLLIQNPDQQLSRLMDEFPAPDGPAPTPTPAPGFVHMLNLYPETGSSVQASTVTSMQRAKAAYTGLVKLVCVQSGEDADLTPAGFERSPDLGRTVADVVDFDVARPLPLLFDILERGATGAPEDAYLIYTNADICLRPAFYAGLAELIGHGFDAIVVNRRTVGAHFAAHPDAALLAAETGENHLGYDCFVFKRSLLARFTASHVCLGMAGVGMALLYNLVAHASQMLILTNVAMTYHFGNDADWQDARHAPLQDHNYCQFLRTLETLLGDPDCRENLLGFLRGWRNPNSALALAARLFPDRITR